MARRYKILVAALEVLCHGRVRLILMIGVCQPCTAGGSELDFYQLRLDFVASHGP